MQRKRWLTYVEALVSVLVVGGLFWGSFFVTPEVQVGEVERFAFERRDSFYSVVGLDDAGQSVCMAGSYGKVIRSDDGGVTWAIQKTPVTTHLQSLAAWDKDTLVAVGDKNTVVLTRDAGRNWKKIEVPVYPLGGQLLDVNVDATSGRAWITGSMGAILVSADRGETWRMAHPQEDLSWNASTVAPDGSLWVVGEFGRVKRSKDLGQSWQTVEMPVEVSLNDVAFADARRGVIVGLSGTLLVTADGGDKWTLADAGTQTHLYTVLWSGQAYHAIGDAGVIATSDAGGQAWSAAKLSPNNYAWYTGISRAGNAYYIAGAGAGIYEAGKWLPFEPSQKVYKKRGADNG